MKKTKIFITAQLTWASANSLVDDSGYEATLHCGACLYMNYRTTWSWKSNCYPLFLCSQISRTHDSTGTHHGHSLCNESI